MSVDAATVRKIASLARLATTEEEVAALVPELNNILGWIEQLGQVEHHAAIIDTLLAGRLLLPSCHERSNFLL